MSVSRRSDGADVDPRFGTDGIRGRAGEPPLDSDTIRRVAAAIGVWLQGAHAGPARVLAGHDGRASATWIRDALAAGLAAADVALVDAGLLTTPALAFLTRSRRFAAGVMISASHNPAEDNGIKVFDHNGDKLDEASERELEALARALEPPVRRTPRIKPGAELPAHYADHLASRFRALDLSGRRIVVDAANGGGSRLFPELLRRFGADVVPFACAPDGSNINAGVGAVHPQAVVPIVQAERACLGICLDGDGDRSIFVDERGDVHDGDEVLALLAPHLHAAGRLPRATVVATEMSNMGLEEALAARHIALVRTRVGDKYVAEAMREGGFRLGGEQSGHILLHDGDRLVGDALLTSLTVLSLPAAGAGFASAFGHFRRWPQLLHNVAVTRKPDLAGLPAVQQAKAAAERLLGAGGRVLLRYSGTEPKCRIMVEGRDAATVQRSVESIAAAVREALR
jgi:phosphoglucosamine mutase